MYTCHAILDIHIVNKNFMSDLPARRLLQRCACPSVNPGCPLCLPSLPCLPSVIFARPAYLACRACCAMSVVLTPPVEAHLPMTQMLRSTHEPRQSPSMDDVLLQIQKRSILLSNFLATLSSSISECLRVRT